MSDFYHKLIEKLSNVHKETKDYCRVNQWLQEYDYNDDRKMLHFRYT